MTRFFAWLFGDQAHAERVARMALRSAIQGTIAGLGTVGIVSGVGDASIEWGALAGALVAVGIPVLTVAMQGIPVASEQGKP